MARTTSPSPSGIALFLLIALSQVHQSLCGIALVQRHAHMSFLANHVDTDEEHSCAVLANQGTHFTVDVEVGTPGQKFSVVADTGSNALIVPDCVCNLAGYCDKQGRCFRGTNKSSTFHLTTQGHDKKPIGIMITFGSGTVQAVVAKETVRVGGMAVNMKDGILLMTQHALRFPGPFEGILGLGVPQPKEVSHPHQQREDSQRATPAHGDASDAVDSIVKDIMKRIFGNGAGAEGFQQGATPAPPMYIGVELESGGLDQGGIAIAVPEHHRKAPLWGQPPSKSPHQPAGFLEQANVPRFSMCFNDGAEGVLRFGTPLPPEHTLETVGKMHWAVDFRGITIGDTTAQLNICSPANMTEGQKTPCGAIPDSGTTNIMLPKEHMTLVLEAICDGWTRCRDNYTALVEAAEAAKEAAVSHYGWDPFGIELSPKSDVLELLLADCDAWMNESDTSGLTELPPVHLHVAGKDGKKHALELSSRAYVTMAEREEIQYVYKELEGIGKIPIGMNKTGVKKTICLPAFSPMDYLTKENGPVWIVGTPLFYEHVVGFDMEASPPAVSFTPQSHTPCGNCGKKAGLVATSSRSARWPRQVNGPDRLPSINLSDPL
mmetsp:Transcript_16616/g.35079  ORF Transcript_16616/g.35079 Transcript_16616/m.35079 type:complete len:604 (+) Transcript_16616:74-1885(+)